MTQILRQSTAVDVLIGPFVDATDGYTPETGISPAVKLSKNGQALIAKADVTVPVHDADGYYNCELDATDTNTVGTLVLTVAGSATALAVRHEYQVIEEAVYDAMYAASAAGPLQSTTAGRTLNVDANNRAESLLGAVTHTGAVIPEISTLTGHVPQTSDHTANISAILNDTGTTLENHLTDIKGTGFVKDANSLPQCITATGFNTVVPDAAGTAATPADIAQALVDIHLDHLFAVDYDPAAKPGVSTALLNELIEDDLGVSRYTANALENAPSGTGASAAVIADAVWDEARAEHTNAGSFGEGVIVESLNTQAKADVNAEVDTANTDYGANKVTPPTASAIVDEWEAQSQLDPTGFQVNVVEVNSVAEDIATEAKQDTILSSAQMNKIADHVLKRAWAAAAASSDGDAKSFRSILGATAKLVNKIAASGTTLNIYEADDTTILGTQTLTTDSTAEPITGADTD